MFQSFIFVSAWQQSAGSSHGGDSVSGDDMVLAVLHSLCQGRRQKLLHILCRINFPKGPFHSVVGIWLSFSALFLYNLLSSTVNIANYKAQNN